MTNSNSVSNVRFRRFPTDRPNLESFEHTLKNLHDAVEDPALATPDYLTELAAFQDNEGFFGVVDSSRLESDCRVAYRYMPTYMAAAIFIRAYLAAAGAEQAHKYRAILEKALPACMERGLCGHGYDAEAGLIEALKIFAQCGLREFLTEAPDICPKFHVLIWNCLDDVEEALRRDGKIIAGWDVNYTEDWEALIAILKPRNRLYLAYGSNMWTEQMLERCPDAIRLDAIYAQDWRLKFHFYADIQEEQGARTPAVLWKINLGDEAELDRREGYPTHYRKTNFIATLNGKSVAVMAYIMTEEKTQRNDPPTECYMNILRMGYAEAGFDPATLG
ncbi:gamma-glutamylcyclotransferase family protein [Bacillota bacterium Meth-B3]